MGVTLYDIAARKERAARARERYYRECAEAAKPVRPGAPGVRRALPMPRPSNRAMVEVEKRGPPCHRPNEGWIKGLASKAFSLAKVLASPEVPSDVFELRMRECQACPYSTKAKGHHWCGCCSCPKWNVGGISSALEYKNHKAAWRCSRPDPAFGPWEQ